MIVRRRPSIDRLLKSVGKRRTALPAPPLAGGPEGPAGRPSGLRYLFDSSTTAADPGTGELRLNNAALSSATSLYISEVDADGNGLNNYLATWDDSTSTIRGHLVLRSVGTGSDFAVYAVTGSVSDEGAWDKLTISHVASGGSFSGGEEVTVSFHRTGDKGETGATGETGKEGAAGAASMNGYKEPCRVATTGNVTIATALNPGDTIDGVTLAENDRVLVWRQTTKKENGIWIVKASPSRATDADAAGELVGGTKVRVVAGTLYAGVDFSIFSPVGSITPGTTEHEWFPVLLGGKATLGGSGNGWYATVTHNFGKAPSRVTVDNASGTFQRLLSVDEIGATTFRVGNWRADGAASTSVPITWTAYP